jgi:hypothetical protein
MSYFWHPAKKSLKPSPMQIFHVQKYYNLKNTLLTISKVGSSSAADVVELHPHSALEMSVFLASFMDL